MAPPVGDEDCSPEPTATNGEPPAEAVKAAVGVAVREGVMEVGAIAAVEEPNEVEPERVGATGAESDEEGQEDPDEDPEEEGEDEENTREEAADASDEETVMQEEESESEETEEYEDEEPREVDEESEEIDGEEPEGTKKGVELLKHGEVQEEESESEEIEVYEDEESREVDEESEEVDGEEPEKTKKGVDAGVIVKNDAKGLVHGSSADDVNEKIELEHVKRCDKNKDEVADILSNGDDAGGSRSGDMQNSKLAGGLELLVDELPRNCVEGDIALAFSESEQIKSITIIRNSSTEKSKDIAFVCFASTEAADKALTEFEKGFEVKGTKVRLSAFQDNNTLFLGNICKSWTQDQVLTALNNIGIQEAKLSMPSNSKGTSRGFAFLKFESHYYARAAFRRLIKSDAVFGIDRRVTVSFFRKPTKPSDDLLIEAKRVYLEHVPLSWNEDKVKECCEKYGKILNVDLFQISKNMKNETFSFVEFSSSNSALACVKGINNAKIVDGSFKLSACLTQPKNGTTSEGATTSKKENNHTEKVCIDKHSLQKLPKGNKGKLTSQPKEVVVKKNASRKLLKDNDRNITSQDATEVQQTSKPSEGERKFGKNKNTSVNQRPLKKARNKSYVHGRNLTYQSAAVLQTFNPSKGKRKPSKDVNTYTNGRPLKKAHNSRNVGRPNRTRAPGQPAGPQHSRAHHSLHESLRSKAYASDLEPHAGYIPLSNHFHSTEAYDQQRIRQYNIHPVDVHPYARETAPSQSTYSDYTSRARYQTGYEYIYPPPPTSGSRYPGRDPFTTRRGDY